MLPMFEVAIDAPSFQNTEAAVDMVCGLSYILVNLMLSRCDFYMGLWPFNVHVMVNGKCSY